MNRTLTLAVVLLACDRPQPGAGPAFDPGPTPAEHRAGEQQYSAACASCHGLQGKGAPGLGPPLVHVIYEPNHHADAAFHRAVTMGVTPHHWSFGPMPRIEQVDRAAVDQIIGYVRWLQRQAGIR